MNKSDETRRVILIDPEPDGRLRVAERLRAQGFLIDTIAGAAAGAEQALAEPPAAVVADLWMPGISGVQLTRLLRAEPATVDVPVILRAEEDDPRSRFWAERAGAAALVSKGRVGELVRILGKVTAERAVAEDAFFMHLGTGSLDIRDRLAHHLDEALFESVIAAEVRALASTCSFDRLFDAFSQLAARLLPYRWLAITTNAPRRLAIHHHPKQAEIVQSEVVQTLGLDGSVEALRIADEDAADGGDGSNVVVRDITFGSETIGRIVVASAGKCAERGSDALVSLFARELGGAIQMAALVEESRRLATTDPLTKLMNRRAFVETMESELARSDRTDAPVSVLLFDVDHFKSINDRFGHRTGDAVLEAIGAKLPRLGRPYDTVARWGGEEFVALLPSADATDAAAAAERFRKQLEQMPVEGPNGTTVAFTVSIGVALRHRGEPFDSVLERADVAMYTAKTEGRNRVCVHPDDAAPVRSARVTPVLAYSAA
jgi:two-component system cell cycle response regulator